MNTQNKQFRPQVFGVFRSGNYIKSRYYQDPKSAIEIMKVEGTEILQQGKGIGTIRLLDAEGDLLYKGKLQKKRLMCSYTNNYLLNLLLFMNKDFSEKESAFLATPEEEVRKIASNLQEKAIEFMNLKKDRFDHKMSKVSDTIVVKKHSNDKVDINGWTLFKKVAKSRDPGKVAFSKLAERILYVYQLGNTHLSDKSGHEELVSKTNYSERESQAQTINMDAKKFVSSLVRMVMVHTDKNEDFKSYLADKNLTLTGEVSEFTRGIFKCEEREDSIKFVSMTGREENVYCTNSTREKFKQTLEMTVTKLVTNAAISDKTRELISVLVDMNSLEDMVYN